MQFLIHTLEPLRVKGVQVGTLSEAAQAYRSLFENTLFKFVIVEMDGKQYIILFPKSCEHIIAVSILGTLGYQFKGAGMCNKTGRLGYDSSTCRYRLGYDKPDGPEADKLLSEGSQLVSQLLEQMIA